jgi:hypothetical protein
MTLEPVQSSNIKAIGYEPATSTLAVQFHSGTKGKHFHKHIRAKG